MSVAPTKQFHGKYRLRTILLIVNLFVLILPLGGLFFFRIYENELVRQTELELISQGAALAAAYKQDLRQTITDPQHYGLPLPNDYSRHVIDAYYTPVYPQVDLAKNHLLPPRPDPTDVSAPADPYAAVVGRRLTPLLQETQKSTLSGIIALDYQGIAVAGQHGIGASFAQTREVKLALRGQYASAIRERDMINEPPALASISRGTGIRVFAAFPVIENNHVWGVLYLSRTPQNILKHLYAERDKIVFAGLTILTITLFFAFFVSATVTRPIHRLIDKTRRVAEGDTEAMNLLVRPGTKEIELLSRSFSKMAHALHARTEYIREFATHMSHELKTPLTGIQGATELLTEHIDDMDSPRKHKFLSNIMQDSERLKRLVNRLLELARADSITPAGESCYIMPILTRLCDKFSDDSFTATIEGEGHYDALLPEDSFESIIANLLENAKQHGAKTMVFEIEAGERNLRIHATNDGEAVSAANRDKIFTPFFTTRREEGGTGLGLGISRSLLEAYGGSITLEDTKTGASFMLTIPVLQ